MSRTPHGIPLIIDSTIATPYLNRPIEWGADIVIHSATKFLGGHGTTLGGVVVESGRFHWHSDKFPLFGEPVPSYGGLQWSGNFGEYAFLTRLRAEQLRDIGPTLAPHSAFLLAQGVETLPYRMQAHVDNARIVAEWLEADPRIDERQLGRAARATRTTSARQKYLPKGPGSVFSFGVKGGRDAGQHLHRIGRTWPATSPTSATRRRSSSTRRRPPTPSSPSSSCIDAGVLPGVVRISVGIEDVDDIIYDLDQALAAATGA